MNSKQFESIDYKDISYNFAKNINKSQKEQINPNIYYNKLKKAPRTVYSKKLSYNRTQNAFYSPSQPYLEQITEIKNAKLLENELQKLKLNYISLNNDNIILREDINQLCEINKQLEQELTQERINNFEFAKENDILTNENQNLFIKIDEVNQKIVKIKDNYQKENEIMNKQLYFEEKINEKDLRCKEIIEENNKLNTEYELLNDKFLKLKEKNNNDENELNKIKQIQEQSLNDIENKLTMLLNEMDKLKYENNQLKQENESYKSNITICENEKNKYYNKYQEQKMKNESTNKKIAETKEKYQQCKLKLENKIERENNKEKLRKTKSDNKINVIKDLHKKIQQYKTERSKKRFNHKKDEDE